jgi:uncharacterized protein (TIGR02145 family)
LTPGDPTGIVASVSLPDKTLSTSGSGFASFTVTFENDVKQRVLNNNGFAIVKLGVSYTVGGATKFAYLNITVKDADCHCPVRVSTDTNPTGWLTFRCRNLGATKDIRSVSDIDSITNDNYQDYHGDWYRFGIREAIIKNGGNSGDAINNWANPSYTESADWNSLSPSDNDPVGYPCPDGWRVPTRDEWDDVIKQNTTIYYNGTAVSDYNNWYSASEQYKNMAQIGDYLFLPPVGHRSGSNGTLMARFTRCAYFCSSMEPNTNGTYVPVIMNIEGANVRTELSYSLSGNAVRCVQKAN